MEEKKFSNYKRAGIPWRFIITALIVILQIIFTMAVVLYAEAQYIWLRTVLSVIWIIFALFIINRDEPASYKLPWITVILIFPLAGGVLFMIFGRPRLSVKSQRRFKQVNPKRTQVLKQDEQTADKLKISNIDATNISKYLLATAKAPVYDNTRSEYIRSGEKFFEKLIKDINSAQEYVFLEYFIVSEGEIWNRLHEALVERVKAGVSVYFIYDDMGSMKHTSIDFDDKLRYEGINCYKFNPFYPIVSIVHNNRDHRKIAVIDGQIAYTGGINVADEYANIDSPFGHWKDCAVRLCGNAVDTFCVMFIENYNSVCEKPLKAEDFLRPHEQVFNDGFVQPFGDGPRPVDEDYIGQSLYLNMIYSAKKYLYIATPYFIVDTNFFEALDSCAKRGVDVRVLVPHIPDKKAVFTITRSSYQRLLKSGVKVYEYKPGFVHSKIVACDDLMAVVGTINFDYRSFVHHYECGAMIYGASCIREIKKDFLKTIENEGLQQNEQTAKLTLFEKLVKNVVGLFAPML